MPTGAHDTRAPEDGPAPTKQPSGLLGGAPTRKICRLQHFTPSLLSAIHDVEQEGAD